MKTYRITKIDMLFIKSKADTFTRERRIADILMIKFPIEDWDIVKGMTVVTHQFFMLDLHNPAKYDEPVKPAQMQLFESPF